MNSMDIRIPGSNTLSAGRKDSQECAWFTYFGREGRDIQHPDGLQFHQYAGKTYLGGRDTYTAGCKGHSDIRYSLYTWIFG